jgi:ABC-type phosphate transport system auxiliary subunit
MGLPALVGPAAPSDNRRSLASNPLSALLEQIDELLTASPSAEPATLARLERTLTDGYAHALSLEAERLRLERRMSELAGELHDGNREQKAQELAQVSRRISRAGDEIESLRGTLSQLRAHATAVRATA